MTSGIPALFLVFLCNAAQLECGIICLSCTGLSEGEQCHNVVSCAQNEVCFTQKYRTKVNVTKYDVGCSYPELCRKDSTGVVFGKRMVDHGHVVCHHCCQDNVCNSAITCSDNYKAPRLSCLSCSGVTTIDKCNSTITCNDNEVCFIQKYRTGLNQEHFDLGCKSSTICMNGLYSNIFGRRSEGERHLLCETCCAGNSFCNRNLLCNHYNQTSINSSCASTSGCKSNLICLSGKCQCPIDKYWSKNSCTLPKGINHVCSTSTECKMPLLCFVNLCKCPTDKYWDGFNCITRSMHNAPCNISTECSETLFCTHGVCKCDRIDYWTGHNCTARNTFANSCLSNDDCKAPQLCVDKKCICNTTDFWDGSSCIKKPKECNDIQLETSGVYTIFPTEDSDPTLVYCVFQDKTKWTVIQRRFNGSVDFYKNWTSYKNGFGNVQGEYWLGNEHIHIISTNGRHKVRFLLGKADGTKKYADYSTFEVGNETTEYMLTLKGYSGTAGDSLLSVSTDGIASGERFTTFDNDNDKYSDLNCASNEHGGWWYSKCQYADLNGRYSNVRWHYDMRELTETMIMITKAT